MKGEVVSILLGRGCRGLDIFKVFCVNGKWESWICVLY